MGLPLSGMMRAMPAMLLPVAASIRRIEPSNSLSAISWPSADRAKPSKDFVRGSS